MPTYEYACKACDHAFEIVQSFSEDSLTTCPECDRDELRKVYNAAGIIFKGDGWHIKDYGKSKSKTSSAAASDTTAANDGGANSSDSSSGDKDSSSATTSEAAASPDAAKKAS